MSGVRPSISRASLPIATILLSSTLTATTEGSLATMPFLGKYTLVLAVPRSMAILFDSI